MQSPNLFTFGKSELSQDAFICWLASWADPVLKQQNNALHVTAAAFLDRLLAIGKGPRVSEYRSIEVQRQWKGIDVLLVVNGDTAIIIEDKTNSKEHSDQLVRYKKAVAGEFPKERIASVYFKTGDQCDYRTAEEAGYGCFLRRDFLETLQRGEALGVKNDIFSDFHRYVQGIERAVQNFITVPLQRWERPQWKGFFTALKERLGEGEWGNRGHPGGGSLTFTWHRLEDKFLALAKDELGFKIAVMDESQRAAKWSEWNKRLLAMNGNAGTRIRPSRRQPGKIMKVAVLDEDYRQPDSKGSLDLDGTMDVLKSAEALMDAAIDSD